MSGNKYTKVALSLMLAGALILGALFAFGADFGDIFGGVTYTGGIFGIGGYRDFGNEYSIDGKYALSSDNVDSIDIHWAAGNVLVEKGEGDQIEFIERSNEEITQQIALRYGVEEGVLYIAYCKSGLNFRLPEKSLTLSLPAKLYENLDAFTVDTGSANLNVSGLGARAFKFDSGSGDLCATDISAVEVNIDAASSKIEFTGAFERIKASSSSGDIKIDSFAGAPSARVNSASGDVTLLGQYSSVDIETASGDIELFDASVTLKADAESSSGKLLLSGAFGELELETTSGTIEVRASECPKAIEADSASGAVRLFLPADSNFTLDYDTASGDISLELSARMSGGKYIAGDGSARIEVETASGNLTVGEYK